MAADKCSSRAINAADDRKDYLRVFRKRVFQLLKWSYDRLDAQKYQDSEEEDITGELVKNMNEILQDRSFPTWVGKFAVHEDPRINASDRKGKNRQRLDIELERVCHGPRPRYPFEAKRLSSNTHATIGKYLGSEGLGEFLAGNYAREADEAGMLGYVQSETPVDWAKKAHNKFKNTPDLVQTCHGGNWSNVNIVSKLEHCYRSKHHRFSVGKPIILYHLFLVFC